MNKVEEMHQSFECGQMVSSSDLSVRFEYTKLTEFSAKIHAQVTEDVACKFAEWIGKENYVYNQESGLFDDGIDNGYGEMTFSAKDLYVRFIKTL